VAISHVEQSLYRFKSEFEKAAREKDRATLNRLIHDDFSLVDPNGNVISKQEVINDIVHPNSQFMDSFVRRELRTAYHVDGNVARETAAVLMQGQHVKHGDITGQYVNTATFVHTANGWKMIGNSLHKTGDLSA
jgi:ketosteroid isomerase-like protein